MATRTTTNPFFYGTDLRAVLADEAPRLERIVSEPDNVDLLTWNVFASLDTHSDRDYLAYRLQSLGGGGLRAPLRISLWTGRNREPLLRPTGAYLDTVRERILAAGGSAAALDEFDDPIEVPVRIESPDVLVLVETALRIAPAGAAGRDRLLELVDAGLEQARRLDATLSVAVVSEAGTPAATLLSSRVEQLSDPARLAAELPHRDRIPPVLFRELTWQRLLQLWDAEREWLDLAGEPVRSFVGHTRRLGLRDQEILGHEVEVVELLDALAVVGDDAPVDDVEGGEVLLRGRATQAVVVPGAVLRDVPGGALRLGPEGGDALGDVVGHLADRVDLRVEHLVDADEARPHDVPVDVLEGQLQVDERVEALLEPGDDLAGVLLGQARDGVLVRHGRSPVGRVWVASGAGRRWRRGPLRTFLNIYPLVREPSPRFDDSRPPSQCVRAPPLIPRARAREPRRHEDVA